MRPGLAAIAALLVVAACSREPAPAPLVLYAYDKSAEIGIESLMAEFTAATGIPVSIHFGTSRVLTDAVIGKQDSPPADALLTSNAADIWRAADEGALRPLQSEALHLLPDVARDADAYWAATMVRTPMLVVATGGDTAGIRTYADLGKPFMAGRLCLASSALPGYRALVAMLVETRGNKPAERIVRGWVRNLAVPPFSAESKLLMAVQSGECEIGLTVSGAGIGSLQQVGIRAPYIGIDAIGVTRHATHPESAQQLVDWIIRRQNIALSEDYFTMHAGVAGLRDQEARLLVERAGYR